MDGWKALWTTFISLLQPESGHFCGLHANRGSVFVASGEFVNTFMARVVKVTFITKQNCPRVLK